MGSRIMHMIIANRIAESLPIKDRTLFLFGSLAPDAVSNKNESHFFKGDVRDYTRHVDYEEFLHQYRSKAGNPYILGYFTHLIADDIWLKGFNLSWMRNRMEANSGLYQLSHNDFRLLNGKLLESYGCKDEFRKILNQHPGIFDLDEVKARDDENFIPYVQGDTEYGEEVVDAKLNVFTFDQILGYIETSVDLGVLKLDQILR